LRGEFAPLFVKKEDKNAFFLKNIWSVEKKAVLLHRFSADV
jgi:hypothetical protein